MRQFEDLKMKSIIFRNWNWENFFANAFLMYLVCLIVAIGAFLADWDPEIQHLIAYPLLSGLFSGACLTIWDDQQTNHLKKIYFKLFKK